ncbi:MAG: hypothetical protein HYR96_05600 [Deltaproteobacteria bacterium]|nr:hypothetical protein [Deltaproteobacteria bacterium]MBI3295779.1 hypothetical protein [Deltaproteobacteria bacterium]
MLTKEKILHLFSALNDALAKRGERGEVGIIGGAAMCLLFDARKSTKDVDGIFKPAATLRKLIAQVAEDERVDADWLNDAAKGFIEGTFDRMPIWNGTHLVVWAPEAKYLLAMKCLSGRWDSMDRKDVEFLVRLLKIANANTVFDIIQHFFPKDSVPPKTEYFLEELFEKMKGRSG